MNEQELPPCESEAIYDISLVIGSIKNISQQWTPNFDVNIFFGILNSNDGPSPYQIIQPKKTWNSSIAIQSYKVDNIKLGPHQIKQIKECCVFRGSMPICWFQQRQLTCFIEISVEGNTLGVLKYRYQSAIGLCSYVPIFSPSLGIQMQAKIQTQVLGIRVLKNCMNDSFEAMYKGIDFIIQESNRLGTKISKIKSQKQENVNMLQILNQQNNDQFLTVSKTSSKCSVQQQQQTTNSQIYQQYSKMKQFKESRIFKKQSKEQHREHLANFVRKVSNENSKYLQWNWQKHIEHSINQCLVNIESLRKIFLEHLATEVKNKVIRNRGEKNNQGYQLLTGKMKINLKSFHLTNKSLKQYQQSAQSSFQSSENTGKHLIVLVHGLGANSLGMAYLQRTIKYLYPNIDVLNSKSNQDPTPEMNIDAMGRNLAMEVEQYLQKYQNIDDLDISFIGYSLGGIVVRAALIYLEVFKLHMNSFISLSTPHLGHVSHSNKLAKAGIMAINAIWHSNIIDQLFLRDKKDKRLTYLYSLSVHSGLSWFKSINLFGSPDDGYVSLNSALIKGIHDNYFKNSQIAEQMATNLKEVMKQCKVSKMEVKFYAEQGAKLDFAECFIGRTSHLSFSTNQGLINCLLLQNYEYFKPNQNQQLGQSN